MSGALRSEALAPAEHAWAVHLSLLRVKVGRSNFGQVFDFLGKFFDRISLWLLTDLDPLIGRPCTRLLAPLEEISCIDPFGWLLAPSLLVPREPKSCSPKTGCTANA